MAALFDRAILYSEVDYAPEISKQANKMLVVLRTRVRGITE
jgi:hypothetical protein